MKPKGGRRTDRIAELIQRKLAYLIQHEFSHPRLPKWMTILDVKLSPDLGHARVYFTAIDENPSELVDILNLSTPFFRTALAKHLDMRKLPQLSFVYDSSVEYGKQLSRLIDDVNTDAPDVDDAEAS